MSLRWPPTVIVVHPRERRSKCSVEPLRGREGFTFWTFPDRGPESLDGYVRLGLGGELLTPADRDCRLLVLDGTWKYAERMEADYSRLPVRSLGPWETAYPRRSKTYADPAAGLATIEAIFAAYVQMGCDPAGLLDHYHWREVFLAELRAGATIRDDTRSKPRNTVTPVIELTTDPIDCTRVLDSVRTTEAGAVVLFLGTVRSSPTDGKPHIWPTTRISRWRRRSSQGWRPMRRRVGRSSRPR